MADADEKLAALKKAYADIILGISKEAAARVMASEKKSVRYEHELKVAKEEGLRMMLRLKQMMDSQHSEAEAALVNQQKKIDELEAQLQEAEDIVSDLRQELREAHAELERVKDGNLRHVNEPAAAYSDEILEENKIYLPPNDSSDVAAPHISPSNECRKCYSKIVCTCGGYNRDLPSITIGKEHGLYRNSRTQRIRACERNLSEEIDKLKERNIGGEKECNSTSKKPVYEAKSGLEKKLFPGLKLGKIQSFPQKRKRAIRRRRTAIPLSGKQSSKPDRMPKHYVKSCPVSVKENTFSNENICSKTSPSLHLNEVEPQSQFGCEEASDKIRHLAEICVAEAMKNDGVDKKMNSLKKVTEVSEGLPSLNCKMDIEKVDVKASHSLESSVPTQTMIGDRVIKYTYQRKRKRQPLSGSEARGSIGTEKNVGEGENGDQKMEQPKRTLLMESASESIGTVKKIGDGINEDKKMEQPKRRRLMESSSDSRRLAQVARQLISLSEKKWWH